MGLALVIASASCVWDDLQSAYDLLDGARPDVIISVNDFGAQWRGFEDWDASLDAFCTLHAEKLPMWRERRLSLGLPEPGVWCTAPKRPLPDFPVTVIPNWGGSSAFLGVSCAINLFHTGKVIVCGAPLDYRQPHFDRKRNFTEAGSYRKAWVEKHDELRDNVRSLSGWTAELYGKPDKEWIDA